MAGSGDAVSMSAGDSWTMLACAGKAGYLDPLASTMGDKSGASG